VGVRAYRCTRWLLRGRMAGDPSHWIGSLRSAIWHMPSQLEVTKLWSAAHACNRVRAVGFSAHLSSAPPAHGTEARLPPCWCNVRARNRRLPSAATLACALSSSTGNPGAIPKVRRTAACTARLPCAGRSRVPRAGRSRVPSASRSHLDCKCIHAMLARPSTAWRQHHRLPTAAVVPLHGRTACWSS